MHDWWKNSVVYQIYPKSFYDSDGDGIGDIRGIIAKLDYLAYLGIDVIWLSPIYDSPQADNGYDIRDYQAINSQYGTMADFDELVKEAHNRKIKILMDLVVNHTSDEHKWFVESRSSKENHYRDYYIWRDGKKIMQHDRDLAESLSSDLLPNNWGSFFGGSAWQYDEQTKQYYLHLFLDKQPDLNWENAQLRQEVYQMMRIWLDKGIDGFRMDVINCISKDHAFPDGQKNSELQFGDGSPFYMNGPYIHNYLQEMHQEVLGKYDVLTVGEMPGVSVAEAIQYTNPENHELNMVFTFEHMDLDSKGDKWNLKPLNLVELKENLEKWQHGLHKVGWNSLYWNNHDQPRIVSRFGNDNIYRVKSAKMLATCLHLLQGTPYIYQGEELGMTNVRFTELADYRDVEMFNMVRDKREAGWTDDRIWEAIYAKARDNARTPFQWDATANAGFTSGTPWIQVNPRYIDINVESAVADSNSVFHYYRQLIVLRKQLPIITVGAFELLLREDPNVFAYKRISEQETLIILCNFSDQIIPITDRQLQTQIDSAEIILANEVIERRHVLSPYQAIVYRKRSSSDGRITTREHL